MITAAVILFGSFMLLVLLNVPIAVSLGASSLLSLLTLNLPPQMMSAMMFASIEKFSLLSIPLYVLAGVILERCGISDRLVRLAATIIGPVWGSLGLVAVGTGIIFSGISGSAAADVAAVGAILIPAMVKRGYSPNFAAGLMASVGSVGPIVPPSILFVIYGILAESSIVDMFTAGFIPGIVMGIFMAVYVWFYGRKHGLKGDRRGTPAEIWVAFKEAFFGLIAPVVVLGGIYTGVFTPEEAGGITVVYGLIVGLFIYKTLKLKDLYNITVEAGIASAVVMFVVSAAGLFSWIIMAKGLAMAASKALLAISSSKLAFLLVANFILFIAGMFLDAISIMYITVPIFLPIAKQMGMHPIHFGMMLCVNLSIGLFTPPVGVNLYVAANLAKVKLKDMIPEVVPFILAVLASLIVITAFPEVTMFALRLFGR